MNTTKLANVAEVKRSGFNEAMCITEVVLGSVVF